jgi:hypothetical protein
MTETTDNTGAIDAPAAPDRPWRAPTLTLLGDADSLTAGTFKTNPGSDGSSMS